MTLQELSDTLLPSFKPSVHKNVKAAVRTLAKALQCPNPQQCPLDQFNCPLPSLYRLIETFLMAQGKSSHEIRNTKNYVSRLFRLAAAQGLLSLRPVPPTPRYTVATKYPRPERVTYKNGSYLLYKDWPPALQESFTAFATWATAPVVPGRDAALKKRPNTVQRYCENFQAYFGFLHHVQQLPTLTFDHLFDIALVTAFVHWHINELHQRPTHTLYLFLGNLLAITKQYRPLPEYRQQLVRLSKTLPTIPPVYNKEDAWVPLATLDEIGRSLWPRQSPQSLPATGQHKLPSTREPVRAGLSLMFRLWTYIPFRQRNIREMKLDQNLHKDAHGHWWITFRGEQLKIAVRRGRPNVFAMPFPPTLVPVLEDYLNIWRPLLVMRVAHPSPYVFLNRIGNPYSQETLGLSTSRTVYRYTGKFWHPHIIRTVWATEWIRNGGDIFKAAVMLNDTLETVIANYAHLRDQNVAEEVYEALDRRNGQGK